MTVGTLLPNTIPSIALDACAPEKERLPRMVSETASPILVGSDLAISSKNSGRTYCRTSGAFANSTIVAKSADAWSRTSRKLADSGASCVAAPLCTTSTIGATACAYLTSISLTGAASLINCSLGNAAPLYLATKSYPCGLAQKAGSLRATNAASLNLALAGVPSHELLNNLSAPNIIIEVPTAACACSAAVPEGGIN